MKAFKEQIELIKQVYEILDKSDRRQVVIVFINIFISAMLETLSVGSIVPFVGAIMSPEILRENQYIEMLCRITGINSDVELLAILGGGLIGVFLLKNVYLIFSSYMQIKFRYCIQEKLSVRMLNSYLKRPYSYFINVNSSEIIRGIGCDVGCVKDMIESLLMLLTQFTTILMISIYLFIMDSVMTIGVLVTSCICVILITIIFRKRVKELGVIQREANASVSKYAYEIITGVKEILVMQRQTKFADLYKREYSKTRKSNVAYATISSCPSKVIETVFVAGLVIFICIRIVIGLDANTFVPQLSAFALGGMKMLPSISAVSAQITAMAFLKPGVNAAYANIKEVEKYEAEKKIYISQRENDKRCAVDEFRMIKINDLCWSYNDNSPLILDKLSLCIERGESIAFIGESGSGKTTLVDIILGLFKPQIGEVTLDGVDIYSIPQRWSKMIAYVQQSIFLVDDTIKHNIAFGIPDDEIDENRVWEALEQAQMKDYVLNKPEGINTVVGERGVKFSGGQRQRIAIARALYNNPEILILDEATAALDNETEEAVLESIEALQGKKTLIIVAHRLTTIRNCDKIYEIKDGKAFLRKREEVIK